MKYYKISKKEFWYVMAGGAMIGGGIAVYIMSSIFNIVSLSLINTIAIFWVLTVFLMDNIIEMDELKGDKK